MFWEQLDKYTISSSRDFGIFVSKMGWLGEQPGEPEITARGKIQVEETLECIVMHCRIEFGCQVGPGPWAQIGTLRSKRESGLTVRP